MKESDQMRKINDRLEFFRNEVAELWDRRPPVEDIEGTVYWNTEIIQLQSLWIKTLENKIHLMRRENA